MKSLIKTYSNLLEPCLFLRLIAFSATIHLYEPPVDWTLPPPPSFFTEVFCKKKQKMALWVWPSVLFDLT